MVSFRGSWQRLRSQQMERVAQSRHGMASRVTPEVEAELLRQLTGDN